MTGYAGTEHITAADQGAFNAALIGTGQFVLDKGNGLEAQVITNNQVRILDGELMMQGRFVRLETGTYVDLTVDSGTQGYYRNDLIVARYTKDAATGVEGCSLVVIKGTAVTSSPADPEYTAADITNGASVLNDFPLWRLPISGINVGTPESMFGDRFIDSMRTLPEIRASVNQIHSEVDKRLEEQDKNVQKQIEGVLSYTKEEALSETTRTAFGLSSDAVPDDALQYLNAQKSELKMNLLWENASPKSSFAAQTLNVDLSDCDILVFVHGGKTDYINAFQFCPMDGSKITLSDGGLGARYITISESDNTIHIPDLVYEGSTQNSRTIPRKIYGIRGVS